MKGLMSLPRLRDKLKGISRRLAFALCAYAILALVAILALDGYLRISVVLLMAFFAVKTLGHAKEDKADW
ncbi:MAG TPA: hypothetical protein DCE18_18100 [Syntrophobacteraceae bacterium]|nr:hypothetical protein [Syntrophobacteraceae bacterium]